MPGDLVSQQSVHYRPAPPDSARYCGDCDMVLLPHNCQLVEPPIEFHGLCDRWQSGTGTPARTVPWGGFPRKPGR